MVFECDTHRLIMIIICAKLFSNPTMHNKVMDRTQTGFIFNSGLEFIKTNILAKFHADWIKTVPSRVYSVFVLLRSELVT